MVMALVRDLWLRFFSLCRFVPLLFSSRREKIILTTSDPIITDKQRCDPVWEKRAWPVHPSHQTYSVLLRVSSKSFILLWFQNARSRNVQNVGILEGKRVVLFCFLQKRSAKKKIGCILWVRSVSDSPRHVLLSVFVLHRDDARHEWYPSSQSLYISFNLFRDHHGLFSTSPEEYWSVPHFFSIARTNVSRQSAIAKVLMAAVVWNNALTKLWRF